MSEGAPVRRTLERALPWLLVGGVAVLAFRAGGFFDQPRLLAGTAVWLGVATLALLGMAPWPRSRPGLLALAGLAGLTLWTALSLTWTPVIAQGWDDLQRLLLYLGFFLLCCAAFRRAGAARSLDPALAGLAGVVMGYGLAARFLPGVFEPDPYSPFAGARLDQPLTYWNAMGLLAALGLLFGARVAADRDRQPWLRAAAAALLPMIALGLYLTFSRGSLVALGTGAVLLFLLGPRRDLLLSGAVAAAGALALVVVIQRLPGVLDLNRGRDLQVRQGLVMLAATLGAGAVAALLQLWLARGERGRPANAWPKPDMRTGAALAGGVAALALCGLLLAGATGSEPPLPRGAIPRPGRPTVQSSAARLASGRSDRSQYWRVALNGFGDHLVQGGGAGDFARLWLLERRRPEPVRDAHSLYIETAAELGLVGLALLASFLAGIAACAWRGRRVAGGSAVSVAWIAAAAAWLVHAGLDWDWEMPAVALIFVAVCGALVALADPPTGRTAPLSLG